MKELWANDSGRWRQQAFALSLCVALASIASLPFFFIGEDPKVGCCGGAMPLTHDAWMHFNQMQSFARGLEAGVLYPRWDEATHDFGAPTTSFYPPGIYYLTSAFYFLGRDWMWAWVGFYWTVMAASALAIYFYARRWMSSRAALVATAVYVFAPNHLLNQYQRGAMGECFSFVWMPLLLLFADDLIRGDRTKPSSFAGLAASIGGFLWTHPPTAYQFTLVFGVFLTVQAIAHRDWRGLLRVAAGLLFGSMLAAAYFYPAIAEQRLVNYDDVELTWPYHASYVFDYGQKVHPQFFALFFERLDRIWVFNLALTLLCAIALMRRGKHPPLASTHAFASESQPLASTQALVPEAQRRLAGGETTGNGGQLRQAPEGRQTERGLSPFQGWKAWRMRFRWFHHRLISGVPPGRKRIHWFHDWLLSGVHPGRRRIRDLCRNHGLTLLAPHRLWVAAGLLASFLMTKFSAPLGRLIPKIEIGVFSWRMLAVTSLCAALLAGAVADGSNDFSHPFHRTTKVVTTIMILLVTLAMSAWYVVRPAWRGQAFEPNPAHYNYATLPRGAPRDVPPMEPVGTASGRGQVTIEHWTPEDRALRVKLDRDDQLQFRTFDFPGWTATVDGQTAAIKHGAARNIVVDAPAGSHRVRLEFRSTPVRRLSNWITALSIALLGAHAARVRLRDFRKKKCNAI